MFKVMSDGLSRRRILGLIAGGAVGGLLAGGVIAATLPLAPIPEKPAPDFALENLDGDVVRLSDFRGRVVIVNFWATWCPPCRFEIPSMQRAWELTRDEGIVMLAVHVGGKVDEVTIFAVDHGAEFPILMDRDSAVIGQWPVRGLPTTIIVNPAGNMAFRAIGGRQWDDPAILAQIRGLKK